MAELRITPSILNADLANLGNEIGRIPSADMIHLDVMDGHFVPNMTFGLAMIESISRFTTIDLDCHLMVEDADLWAPKYSEIDVESVSFHLEASKNPQQTIKAIQSNGVRASLAIKPNTNFTEFKDLISLVDMVLIMTVEPGFGGQKFMRDMMDKVRQTREAIGERSIWIQVDGGISLDTISEAMKAGADTFVAGSVVFNSEDPDEMINRLREVATAEREKNA